MGLRPTLWEKCDPQQLRCKDWREGPDLGDAETQNLRSLVAIL